MSVRTYGLAAAAAVVALGGSSALAAVAGPSGGRTLASVAWTRITSNTREGIASAGVYRTSDGRLHVVWQSHDSNGFSLHYSTLSHAKVAATGKIFGGWSALTTFPRLVPASNGGIRLVFTGANGVANSPYNLSTMYSATSGAAGATWSLTKGSMSQSKLVPLTDDAAVNESSGTPVAAWGTGGAATLAYHVGIDPNNTPAAAPDQSVSTGTGGVVIDPTLARDSGGHVWAAWFNESGTSTQGYYVDQILPTAKARVKAPGSGSGSLDNNQPLEAVAFTERVGGGLYLAYCVPSKTLTCAHIALWRVGSSTVRTVPGSTTGHASHVAIAAGPNGHLWIGWYDSGLNKIRLVLTNSAASSFGAVRSLNAPPGSSTQFDGLQLEGSKGPLDVIPLTLNNNVTAFWATEIKP